MFSSYGEVTDVVVIKDRETGKSKGFGFVTFDTDDSAESALEKDGEELNGRPMKVNIAKPKESRPRGGGGGGGGYNRNRY